MTYDAMCTAALLIHETEYRISGDRYATAAEMDMIRQDPLAFDDQIMDMLVLATGHFPSRGEIRQASAEELLQAAQSAAKNWQYVAERAARREAEEADVVGEA